jgi:NitT/TauT family transport system permease protein
MQPRTLALGIAILAVLAVIWEVLVRVLNVAPFLLPPPSAIAHELASRLPLYLQQSWATLWASILGFLVAAVAGILLGTMIVYSWVLRGILYPVILVLQVVPKVALAPLFIVWVGYGIHSRILVAAVIAFFPIVMNTVVGLSSVERELLDLVRMLRGSRGQEFAKVAFPHAMPFIFSGLKVAVTFAVIGEIVAEFISGNEGLGYLILVANSEMNVAMSFAAIILLSIMGLALFGAMELLERLCVPWSAEDAEQALAVT